MYTSFSTSSVLFSFKIVNNFNDMKIFFLFFFLVGNSFSQCLNPQPGGDCDGDGIINANDSDKDNDGITDIAECPTSNTEVYLDNLSLLQGTNPASLVAGNVLLQSNAVTYLGNNYDVVVRILSSSLGSGILYIFSGNLRIDNPIANQDPYFTFSIRIVQPGSATPASPLGTLVTIPNIRIGLWDVDGTGTIVNIVDVVGYSTTLSVFSVINGTLITNAGFLGGNIPGFFHRRPSSIPATNSLPTDINSSSLLTFNTFGTGNFLFGCTGANSNPHTSGRDLSLSIRSEYTCDTDGDGLADQIDLDSDNDGCFDVIEAYNNLTVDSNNDGKFGSTTPTVNVNGLVNGAGYPGTSSWVTTIGGPACAIFLPVELVEFKAEENGETVTLEWTTESEFNNDYFEVEKSYDGQNWFSLAKVNSLHNTTSFQSKYKILDEDPGSIELYYRLKQVDFNGNLKFYSPVFLKLDNITFELYPNPANNQFKINYKDINPIDIQIFDVFGHQIEYEILKASENQIIISSLFFDNGFYTIKIVGERVLSKSFQVQH